ncbi:HdeD family acid-resistance protein [Nocardia rhizosphaerae]|uniref:HdeD family acid-resistance protein n=1 Tax=Nocardia rhizosphaerae TaxID=1691571 RepID=A0ABV8LBK8_9NOCA
MPVNDGEGKPSADTRQAMRIAGGCSIVLGLATLVWPGRTESSLALLFGSMLLVSALMQGYLAVRARISPLLRVLVLVSAVLTMALATLAYSGGNIELLALWIGIGWAVRGIVQALVAVWEDQRADSWLHEVCGLCTAVIGIAVIAMKFQTVTGLANVAGAALVVIGVLELLTGGVVPGVLRSRPAPEQAAAEQA